MYVRGGSNLLTEDLDLVPSTNMAIHKELQLQL